MIHSRILKAVLGVSLAGFLALLGWFYLLHYQEVRKRDERYQILAISTKSLGKEQLPVAYFAEKLQLSKENPINLFVFSTDKAEEILRASPYIESVRVERIKPSVLFIEYKPREAVARIGNFSLAAIDREGILFPYLPHTNYSHLPLLTLDLVGEPTWGSLIARNDLERFFRIRESLDESGYTLESLDFSRIEYPTLGRREIIATIQGKAGEVTLRLPPRELDASLQRFSLLKGALYPEDEVIDLRLSDLAYIMGKS